jgi:hypothetical protein
VRRGSCSYARYPDRFLLGSDTWINERWEIYGDIMASYRACLVPKIAAQIANGNAVRRRALRPETRQGSAYSRQL